MVDRFQEDFAKLQNLRLSAPEQSLRDYILKAEEREKRAPLGPLFMSTCSHCFRTQRTKPNAGRQDTHA